MTSGSPSVKEALARRIAGEIVLSSNPGLVMRKWRRLFNVTQAAVASAMGVKPSVVSDYESGRRRNPGSTFIRRFVEALLEVDEKAGGRHISEFARLAYTPLDAILDVREFPTPVKVRELVEHVDGEVLTCPEKLDDEIYGYTVIDSIQAIRNLSGMDFYRVFGATTVRALVFTGVVRGRSPMVAVKISPFKPKAVVIHGKVSEVDPLAIDLAGREGIPLILSKLPSVDELLDSLRKLYFKSLQSRG